MRRSVECTADDFAVNINRMLAEIADGIEGGMEPVVRDSCKVARKLALHTDSAAPTAADTIPVWLRSEWRGQCAFRQRLSWAVGLPWPRARATG